MAEKTARKMFVNFAVRDLKKSKEFFSALGFSFNSEGLLALSCGSRAEVDALVKKALAAGGQHAMDPQDHGFMYGWSFYDPDGHHWEVFWMDPKAAQ